MSEGLPIESLYALELAMLRYPGLELERISYDAMIQYEDEETGGLTERHFFPQNLVAFVFRGPQFEGLGRPRSIVPVNRFALEEPLVVVGVVDSVIHSLDRLVRNQE